MVESDSYSSDFVDRVGHGTAIAALIHSLAPFADLVAVRVFDHSLATSIHRIIPAIDWCLLHNVQIINLSFGTTNPYHREAFLAAVDRVKNSSGTIVSAFEMNAERCFPDLLQVWSPCPLTGNALARNTTNVTVRKS